MKRILLAATILLLTACAGVGQQNVDFTKRSTMYGWVNIDEVDGNHLFRVVIKQYLPKTDKPYYYFGVAEFKDGYLFYANGMANGSYKLDEVRTQTCFGLCGNTIYKYSFGSQGSDTGTAVMKKPGVYFLGSYDLIEEDTGFFEQDKFSVKKASNPPSQKEMLQFLIKKAPKDHPIVARRIRQAMGN